LCYFQKKAAVEYSPGAYKPWGHMNHRYFTNTGYQAYHLYTCVAMHFELSLSDT